MQWLPVVILGFLVDRRVHSYLVLAPSEVVFTDHLCVPSVPNIFPLPAFLLIKVLINVYLCVGLIWWTKSTYLFYALRVTVLSNRIFLRYGHFVKVLSEFWFIVFRPVAPHKIVVEKVYLLGLILILCQSVFRIVVYLFCLNFFRKRLLKVAILLGSSLPLSNLGLVQWFHLLGCYDGRSCVHNLFVFFQFLSLNVNSIKSKFV